MPLPTLSHFPSLVSATCCKHFFVAVRGTVLGALMRTLLGALLGTILGAATSHASSVTNRVLIEHGKLVINHDKSIPEITKAQMFGGFKADIGLGLYQSRMTTELEIKPKGEGGASGLSITTRIKTSPVIYIAKEFPADSCAYKVVLKHEWQHYLFDRDVLRELNDDIYRLTQTVFATPMPKTQAELERAQKVFLQKFKYVYEGRSFPLHSRIDSPESYAELAGQCQGEIKKRLSAVPDQAPTPAGRQ